MDRNTILAFLLIGLVLLLWPLYQKKVIGERQVPVQEAPVSSEQENGRSEMKTTPVDESVVTETRTTTSVKPVSRIPRRYPEKTIVVSTDYYRGELSSIGGGTIVSWKLKKFLDSKKENWIELLPEGSQGNLALMLRHLDGRTIDLSEITFQVISDSKQVDQGDTFRTVRYAADISGVGRVEKTFLFKPHQYDFNMEVSFKQMAQYATGRGYTIEWNTGLMNTENKTKDDLPYYEALALQGEDMLKTKEKATGAQEGTTHWIALRTKYFLAAIVPETEGSAAALEGTKTKIKTEKGEEDWKSFDLSLIMPPGEQKSNQFLVYIGPMDYPLLKSYNAQLEKMINFGWIIIRPFSIAFFHALQFLYKYIGNYGWAIIIFSIFIKLALYPLTRKSFQSMKKMQELQPKMNALREKYKKEPQKLNQETMKLYKEEGVNPMGGCLPMALQMPVLFALFNLFRTTIMLRQAEFLMIGDLSAPDMIIAGSVNLLPILLGITMVVQQRLSSTQNPQQKAMAYFMPVFLLFIFYRLSAGLNLYYLMFNALTIAQELIIKKNK